MSELTQQLQAQMTMLGLDGYQISDMFSIEGIIAMLIFSSIGFVYYRMGKKEGNAVKKWTGITLFLYSYFVSKLLFIVIIGLILVVIPYAGKISKMINKLLSP